MYIRWAPLAAVSTVEGSRFFLQPFTLVFLTLEFSDLDPVYGRTPFPNHFQLPLVHLPHPQDAMSLQPTIRQVDRPVSDQGIEVAATDQNQGCHIVGEFQQQAGLGANAVCSPSFWRVTTAFWTTPRISWRQPSESMRTTPNACRQHRAVARLPPLTSSTTPATIRVEWRAPVRRLPEFPDRPRAGRAHGQAAPGTGGRERQPQAPGRGTGLGQANAPRGLQKNGGHPATAARSSAHSWTSGRVGRPDIANPCTQLRPGRIVETTDEEPLRSEFDAALAREFAALCRSTWLRWVTSST
jgi:hypothetical protein